MSTPQTNQTTPETFLPWESTLPALAAAYSAALARVQAAILTAVLRQFRLSGRWYEEDAAAFASIVPSVVHGGQQAVSAITAAHLDRQAELRTGVSRPAPAVAPQTVTGAAVRNGADPVRVYRRPYTSVWRDLAADVALPVALERGERRIQDLVNTDLQLAKTHTAREVGRQDTRFTYYRRVPGGPHACALCLITSTVRYHKANLLPIHANCQCGIETVEVDTDPGRVLDAEFLAAVHGAIARDLGEKYVASSGRLNDTEAREVAYRDIVIVLQHGEIGPVLGVRGQNFMGPDDIARLTTHDKIESE